MHLNSASALLDFQTAPLHIEEVWASSLQIHLQSLPTHCLSSHLHINSFFIDYPHPSSFLLLDRCYFHARSLSLSLCLKPIRCSTFATLTQSLHLKSNSSSSNLGCSIDSRRQKTCVPDQGTILPQRTCPTLLRGAHVLGVVRYVISFVFVFFPVHVERRWVLQRRQWMAVESLRRTRELLRTASLS